jgi:phage protein U
MRGDGTALGWFVIEKISERASYLDRNGVGQVIELDITVKRSDPPRGGTIFSIISGISGLG